MCPVVVAEHLGRLEELAVSQPLLKFDPGNEVILVSIAFLAPRRPGRVRHREIQVRDTLHELADQRRFTGARRRRNDENRGVAGEFTQGLTTAPGFSQSPPWRPGPAR